jgi:hypothetical protein
VLVPLARVRLASWPVGVKVLVIFWSPEQLELSVPQSYWVVSQSAWS